MPGASWSSPHVVACATSCVAIILRLVFSGGGGGGHFCQLAPDNGEVFPDVVLVWGQLDNLLGGRWLAGSLKLCAGVARCNIVINTSIKVAGG
mgnify:CR=1 FL=1